MKLALYPIIFSLLMIPVSTAAQTDDIGSGRALRFDGINDYIDLGNIYDDLTLPMTISAWVKLDGSPGAFPIFTSQDGADLYNGFWFCISTSNVWIEIGDGKGGNNPAFRRGKTAPANIPVNQWFHVSAVMRNPDDVSLYINGIDVGGYISGGSALPMDSQFPADIAKIGYLYSNEIDYWFKGMLDEVRMYNVALSQTQIRQTMCKKLNGNETGLIGYWNFNETSGIAVADKSSKGFNGTIMNGPVRLYSGAPLGDESVFLYPTSWATAELTMNEGIHQVTVSGVSANTAGAHIYAVRNMPSQTSGIDTDAAAAPYFGAFVADGITGRTFDLEYSDACELVFRVDNSMSTWTVGTIENILNRTEFIRQGVPMESTVADLGPDEELCPFTARILKPVDDPQGYTFLWQDGSTNATFNASSYGTYWVNVRKGCFFDRDTINFIREERQFSIELGEDQAVCPLEPFVLQPLSNPTGYTFTWSNGSLQSTLLVEEYGKYWVSVEHECGTASDTIRFSRPDFEEIKIPNIITPNNDNLNDLFEVGEDLQGATLEIFNRWGKKVYHNSSYQNTWNAENLPTGVYYYILHSACIEDKKGWLSVTR